MIAVISFIYCFYFQNMVDKEAVLNVIKSMDGVEKVFFLDDEILEKLREEEKDVKAILDIDVINEGFNEVLKRDYVLCIIKNTRFRPPPEPTVLLVSDKGVILGREVFPHDREEFDNRDDVVWLSEDFVMFPDAKGGGKEFFIMPPVSFPELNEELGCKDVVSCSPSPTSDVMLKKYYNLKDDPRLASILVGFNDADQS